MLGGHEGSDGFAEDRVPDAVRCHEIENDDGHFVVHAEGECGGVHHLQPFGEGFRVGDTVVPCRRRILFWIGGVDAIDLGCFEDDLGTDFTGSESGGGVCGEEGVAGSCDEDDDASLFEVSHGLSSDEGFCDALDGDGGLDAGGDSEGFQLALEGHSVDHRGEHAHVVGGGSLHALVACGESAPDVSASDDHCGFDAHGVDFLDLSCDAGDDAWGDALGGCAVFQGFAAHFEDDPFVSRFTVFRGVVAHFVRLSVSCSGEESRKRRWQDERMGRWYLSCYLEWISVGDGAKMRSPRGLSPSMSAYPQSFLRASVQRSRGIMCGILAVASAFVVLVRGAGAVEGDDGEFFEKRVRPLLAEHCLECHSAAKKIKGGLRLDFEGGWRAGGDSGALMVPGDVEASLLVKVVRYADVDLQMPPRRKMSASEIGVIEEWVLRGGPDTRKVDPAEMAGAAGKGGAKVPSVEEGRKFWAFQAPRRREVPRVGDGGWSALAVDRFLLARMEAEGLRPIGDADGAAVLRRLTTLLAGLPPEPGAVEVFCREYLRDAQGAVEREVDRLLGRREFAEAFGRRWLDMTRFAESSGGGRTLLFKDAWRYRDYVIASIHGDVPLNRFISEQVAGDLMPWDTVEQRRRQLIATGFLALGPTNYEEQDKQQLRFDIIDEQLDTIGKVFLGQTVGCARCHDHKFDPIPQRDYYAMAGIFSSTRTLFNLTDNVARWMTEPLPGMPEEERLAKEHAERVGEVKKRIEELRATVARLSHGGAEVDASSLGEVNVSALKGIVVDEQQARLVGQWTRSRASKRHVGEGYLNDGNEAKGEKTATFTPQLPAAGRYEVRFAYPEGSNRAQEVRVTVFHADGEETIVLDQTQPPSVDGYFTSLGTFRFEKDGAGYVLVSNAGSKGFVVVDAVQFIPEGASDVAAREVAGSAGGAGAGSLENAKKEMAAMNGRMKALEKAAPARSMAMVVGESGEIGDTEIRVRGVAKQKGARVPRGFMQVAMKPEVRPTIREGTSGRLDFAAWLTADDNPLTARVLVNRVWAWVFGSGLVLTTENFGTTGEAPSHPELLDDLTVRFIEQGWSLKRLVREMVVSRAWRQATAEPLESDPQNRLWSRQNRRRLDADQIRDGLLAVSGRLDPAYLGPNINGAREINANDSGSQNIEYNYAFTDNRRSVYTPAFRNKRHEVFEVFDFGDINNPIGVRENSTVAPQALFFLNSAFVGEQAIALGERFAALDGDVRETVEKMVLTVLGRGATADEMTVLMRLAGERELPALANEEGRGERGGVAVGEAESLSKRLGRVAHALFASVDFRYLK